MLRVNFIPIVTLPKGTQTLDWLSSGYTQLWKQNFSYTSHMISQDEEFAPDLISINSYGEEDYWWVIMQFNSIQFPLTQLAAGTVIKIPNLNQVLAYLNTNNPNSPNITQSVLSV